MELKNLEIYQLCQELSAMTWKIYEKMDWHDKKIIGDQWLSAIDSIGANIAEGFGRYHYLDKNKFNYNARGSLLEAIHWTDLLRERNKIPFEEIDIFKFKFEKLHIKLNNYIRSTKEQSIK